MLLTKKYDIYHKNVAAFNVKDSSGYYVTGVLKVGGLYITLYM